MKRTALILFLLAVAASVRAQSSPAFDPDVYLPIIGNGIDTVQGHDATGSFGAGIINLGPSPESGGFGRIAMRGLPGNEAYLTTIQTGHSFDLQNLNPIRKLHFNVNERIVHWGHLRSLQTTDIVIDRGTGFPIIYWGDSLGDYDSARFTTLTSPKHDRVHATFGQISGSYTTFLTSDTVEDLVWMIEAYDDSLKADSIYVLLFYGGARLSKVGGSVVADTTIFVGTNTEQLYRRFSQGDWRGVGRDDLIAEEKNGGNWHYFKNDPPFSLAKFAEAMIGDTIFRTRDNPAYEGMFENQKSLRALPKLASDRTQDFVPYFEMDGTMDGSIFIFRGGSDFGSHRLTLDSAEATILSPRFYDSQLGPMQGFGPILVCGDMTGTGNPVIVSSGGILFDNLNFFYVLGKAAMKQGKKVDMYYTDQRGISGDTLTSDTDTKEDLLMGNEFYSRLMLLHGSSKIPVKLNPKYGVEEHQSLAAARLLAYPNPASTRTMLTLEMAKSEEVTISVRDVLGRAVWQEKQRLGEGIVQTAVHFGALANGTYVVEVEGSSVRLSTRIAVLR